MLQRDASATVTKAIVRSLESLDEPEFWEHGSEGVAVFAAQDFT